MFISFPQNRKWKHLICPSDEQLTHIHSIHSAAFAETHPLFELLPLLHGHCVGFCNNRYDVDRVTQAPHKLSVQLTETGTDGKRIKPLRWDDSPRQLISKSHRDNWDICNVSHISLPVSSPCYYRRFKERVFLKMSSITGQRLSSTSYLTAQKKKTKKKTPVSLNYPS